MIAQKKMSFGFSERTAWIVLSFLLLEHHPVTTAGVGCPDGFELVPIIDGASNKDLAPRCYKFSSQARSFEDSVKRCKKEDSILATPKNQVYAESLARYILKNKPSVRRYWIGLTDQDTEGVFKWEGDGGELSANFSSWMVTEPESKVGALPGSRGDEQDCVKMAVWVFGRKSAARYYDTLCEKLESYVCERGTIIKPEGTFLRKEIEEGSTPSVSPALRKNLSESDEEEVDFIAPKDAKNSLQNRTKSAQSNESVSAGKEHFPIEVIAYGGDLEEDNTGETKDDRKSALNSTEKSDPQQDPEKSILGTGINIQLKKNSPRNRTTAGRRGKVERRSCHLTCMPGYMRAACPMKYFPEMRHTRVVLNNATCRPRRNRTHLIVHTSLDGCGTTVQNEKKKNKVSFRNTIHLIPRGSGIVRNQKMASALTEFMVLECRYPQEHSVSHNFFPAEGKPHVYKTIEEGPTLQHLILLYKSEDYDCPYAREEYPVKIALSKRVYLEVTLDMPSERVELHPITCFATPDANPYNSNNYVMMQDGCIEDETFRIEESDSPKVSRLSVEAFRFVGFFRKVYVHCDFVVCAINSASSPDCPYACNPETRYRRSAEEKSEIDENQRHIMSHSGMINIVDEEEIAADEEDSKHIKTSVPSDAKQKVEPQALESEGTDDSGGDGNSGTKLSARMILVMIFILPRLILGNFGR